MKTQNRKQKIISKIQMTALISGTVCYLVGLFLDMAYKEVLIDVSLLCLGLYSAFRAVELYIKLKEEENDEKST